MTNAQPFPKLTLEGIRARQVVVPMNRPIVNRVIKVERWPVIREGHPAIDGKLLDLFLYEGVQSGVGQTVDWQRAASIAKRGRMILAGGLGIDNIATAIRTVHPWGVDVSSAVEAVPGRKDPGLITLFVKAAKAVERSA